MTSFLRTNIEAKIGRALGDDDAAWLESRFVHVSLDRSDQLVVRGTLARTIYLVESGATHTYIVDHKGDVHTVQFGCEGYWIGDISSFFQGCPALFSVEALEPTTLLAMSYDDFEEACARIMPFEHFIRLLIQGGYIGALQRIAANLSEPAEQRYLTLLERQPDLVQRIPQYLVASFLGIKPQSLSRIRRRIAKRPVG
jgi:CRP-like cAMP-binding protein